MDPQLKKSHLFIYRGYFEEVFSSHEENNSTSNSNNISNESITNVNDEVIVKKETSEDMQHMLEDSKNDENIQGNSKCQILGHRTWY